MCFMVRGTFRGTYLWGTLGNDDAVFLSSFISHPSLMYHIFRVLKATLYDCWIIIGPLGIFLVGNALFVILHGLNIMWFMTILRMVIDTITKGQVIEHMFKN